LEKKLLTTPSNTISTINNVIQYTQAPTELILGNTFEKKLLTYSNIKHIQIGLETIVFGEAHNVT